jgi:glycosyltransferase involved in cell wall biosynthesis
MKILVISHEYPPIGGGGGQVVADVCTHLAARGHQVYVLTALFGDLARLEVQGNLTIERIPSCRTQAYRAGFATMGCFILKAIGSGSRVIREFHPDVIQAHFAVPAGAAAYVLSDLFHIHYVITAHGGDVPGGAPQKTDKWFRLVQPFTKPFWKKAARVISVSEQTRRFALQHYPVDIQVIPNGIDTQACQPGKFDPKQPPHILYIGRFSPEKNAIAVPAVLERIRDLDWQCAMLGDGPQMEDVKRSLAHSGLSERVELPGWVSPQEVNQWLAKSDILLMPSLLDSMPIAGLQGLAMGLALVLSDIGSCPDYIDEGRNGFLVTPGDVEGYAEALRRLLSDKDLLKNARAASRAHAHRFDLTRAIDDYEKILAEAAA